MKPDGVMVDDKGDFEPSEFFVQLGMLILESRLPSISIKGRQDGPHCPRDVGMWSGHVCESTSSQCTRANQILKQMQTLWRNQVPLCIEVLILPSCQHGRQKSILTDVTPPYEDDGYVLLEQWTIQTVQKKSDETYVSPKTLFQALKSYLHFSQLSSWLSSSQGSKPPSIGYRVSPPAEFCTTTFTRDPQLHVFPIGCINKSTNFKVWLAYLSRMPEIPEPICYELSKDGQPCSKSGKCTPTIDGTNKKRVSRSKSPRPRYEAVFQNIKGSPKLVSKSCNSSSVKRQPNQQSQLASIHESPILNSSAISHLSNSHEITLPIDTNSKDDAYGIGLSDHRLCHEGRTLKRSRPLSKNSSNNVITYEGVSVADIEKGVSNMNFSSKKEPKISNHQKQVKNGSDFRSSNTSDNCEYLKCNCHQIPPAHDDNNVAGNLCLKDTSRSFDKIKPSSSLDSLLNSDLERSESPRPQLISSPPSASFCPVQKIKTKKDFIGHQKSLADSRASSAIDVVAKNECLMKRSNSPARVFLKDQYFTDSDTSCSPDLDHLLSETLGKRELPLNPQEMSDCLFQICLQKQLQSNRIIPFSSKSSYCADPSRKFHCDEGDKKKTKIIGNSINLNYTKSFEGGKSRKFGDVSNFVIRKRVPSGSDCQNSSKTSKGDEYKNSQLQRPHKCDKNLINKSHLNKIKLSGRGDVEFSQSKKSKSCFCFMNEFGCSVCCTTCMETMNLQKTLQILHSIKKQNKTIDGSAKKNLCHDRTEELESNFYAPESEKSNEKRIVNRSLTKNEISLKPIFSVGEEGDDEVFNATCESDEISGKHFCEKAISDDDCRKKISKSLSTSKSSSIYDSATSRHKSLMCHSNDVNKSTGCCLIQKEGLQGTACIPSSTLDLVAPSIYEHDQHQQSNINSSVISALTVPQRMISKTPQENLSKINPLLNFVLKQKVQLENSSDSICDDSITKNNGTICKKDLQFKSPKVPSEKEKSGFKVRVQHSSSMVFNANTKLPMQSSPVPAKRLSSGCFDYDSSLNSVQAIKNSLSCNNLDDQENSNGGSNRLKQALSTSAPASTNCLLGSFEESLINGRIEPAGVIDGFTADIGASGSFCPAHLTLPCLAFFFSLSDDSAPSPYLGHINLESHSKRGYRVPNKGTVQVTLFNPNKSVVKIFVAAYDVSDMPPNHQTLLRQRTLYMPTPGSPSDVSGAPVYLRYLIHLRFASSKQNKIYLHTDIRLIFARDKFELDSRIYHYELRSFNEAPENPKYSPRR